MSSPFRFGLERVRELRVHDEDRAKEAFAASLGARVRGEALLRAADERLREAHDAGRAGTAATGTDLARRQAWLERLERSRSEAEDSLDTLEDELVRKRLQLTDASQRREVLERLKDRRRQEHVSAAARAETAVLDEIALRGFSAGRSEAAR